MNNKKRVLYIGTPIFNYHKQIIAEFETYGFEVDYYNDRPSESSIVKGLIKINKNIMSNQIREYFDNIVAETKSTHYDLVFVVNGKVFTPQMMSVLRKNNLKAKFVLYMWDSLTLYPHTKELMPFFDTCYSFDAHDCSVNDKLKLLPLFYSRAYESLGNKEGIENVYDIASICTAHPVRYRTMSKLFPILEKQGLRIFSFMFLNRLQFLYNKVFVNEFKKAKSNEFNFTALSENEILSILLHSNTVFDIQHNMQTGLTMRTIETLGAKRKLITTNNEIIKYDFYDPNNIFVLNNENWDGIAKFIRNEFTSIDENIYKKYSINSWVRTIIED